MQRLFSYLLVLSCLFIYHHLVLSFIRADDTTLCDAKTKQSLNCANLGNLSYPFGNAEPCAESESFRMNCSSSQAYWDSFSEACSSSSNEEKLGAPALTGIYQAGYVKVFINLTWRLDFWKEEDKACEALLAKTVNNYIPEVIDLNDFANGSFLFSSYNYILLLNCASLPSSELHEDVQINTPICIAYQQQCAVLQNTPCAQIVVPTKELRLQQTLDNFSCTHFQFLVATNEATPTIPSWTQGLVQLFYGDAKCEACDRTHGKCIYDQASPPTFQECACGSSTFSPTDCLNIQSHNCRGLECKGYRIAIGVATVVVLMAAASCFTAFCCYHTHKKRKKILTKPVALTLAESSGIHDLISRLNLDGLTERPVEYSYASLASATNSFSNFLGEGGFGAVYRGTLADARSNLPMQVAVKVLKPGRKQFLNEVATIGRIHHFHVVRLLGFCIEQNIKEMLVYEYVSNGSLDTWLFNHRRAQNQMLHWEQRYGIALGIAKGLSYLHEECRHRIVHCDIKPHNILLDEQMCPKIADFGLARLMSRNESQAATWARGTPGYMAPEFWMGGKGQLSTKFDVYSYGMVLLELMSGHRNFEDGLCFPEMAFEAAMRGDFKSIMDVKLAILPVQPADSESKNSEGILQGQQVRAALFVALWCIQDHPSCRPSMSEVVTYLEGMAAINEQPPRPAITSTMSIAAQQRTYLNSYRHYDITPLSGGRMISSSVDDIVF